MPHSVLALPRQRPARASHPARSGGYRACTRRQKTRLRQADAAAVLLGMIARSLAGGVGERDEFQLRPSSSTTGRSARRPALNACVRDPAENGASARASGSTLRCDSKHRIGEPQFAIRYPRDSVSDGFDRTGRRAGPASHHGRDRRASPEQPSGVEKTTGSPDRHRPSL